MEAPRFISHLKQDTKVPEGWTFQSNEEHSKGVAELASNFASSFGCSEIGYVLGELHDAGKEQHEFQDYIRKHSGYMPEIKYAPKTPHAYVGALLAKNIYPHLFPILSMPIVAHHSGLYDSVDFEEKMNEPLPKGITIPRRKDLNFKELLCRLQPENEKDADYIYKDLNHLIRVLFSSLVDADYLDTERFMSEETFCKRGNHDSLSQLAPRLDSFLSDLSAKAPQTELNKIRAEIQEVCLQKSEGPSGFYSLTVPTGGGKTLSSLLWAIKHAIKNGKERIIIAIPYTSIIVQTAATLRKIFGDENVCEHHSNFDPDEVWKNKRNYSELEIQQRLATENWDYPIVVTTNVQLFESMFSNKPSTCRKLHNLANSVLILDEVQTLPCEFLQPIVSGLESFQRLFSTSVLFTTASQPVLTGNHRGTNDRVIFKGLKNVTEIIPSTWELHNKLRRVSLQFDEQLSDYDEIANRISQYEKVLCIVNTRNDAAEIFNRLPNEGYTFHLSRRMCPLHIQETIEEIRQCLMDPTAKVIRVVATQLIEAGVDIDFPVVFRQEAGLDSILQAAGRCNREGKLGICTTYVFKLNKPLPKGMLSSANNARLNLVGTHNWFSPETMSSYFVNLYAMCDSFDEKKIMRSLTPNKKLAMNFQQAASDFKLIYDKGKQIVINYKNSLKLIERLKDEGFSYELSKKLSKFVVSIYDDDFKLLAQAGLLEEVVEGLYVLLERKQYDEKTGLTTKNHWMDEILIQ